MKNWFTAQEIADLGLKSLPNSKASVIRWAKKGCWTTRKRSGRGGGLEYSFDGLPADAQAEIKAKLYKAMLPAVTTESREIALINRDLHELTTAQRETADARLRMALLVGQYEAECGNRTKAIKLISKMSRDLALPITDGTDYNEVCQTALAKQLKRPGVGTRKLHQWCLDADKCETPTDRLKVLAPQKQGQPIIEPMAMSWLPDFMAVYRNTNGMCVAEAYRIFKVSYGMSHGVNAVPHYTAVLRALDKMPEYVREAGRVTGARMKELRTYIKRDWNTAWFVNNDVWVGDGHSLKMKVQHPDHGRPFTPELTVIMDAPSRYIVGWSLSYSESQMAVADALRHGMVNYGIPAIYYSDNGGGQTNKAFDADITGILPRLGVHHETGIPGNPQGRGIIERFMKVVPKYIAQQFETYYGAGADRETTRKTLVAVDSLAKAESEDKELTPIQKNAKGKLPTWDELLEVVEAAVHWYNHEHTHSSINTTPAVMRKVIAEKMSEDDIVLLTEAEAADLYRPAFIRKVERAYIRLFNGQYWHKNLEPLNGEEVVVYVDQHDPSAVIVRHQDGSYICEAKLGGNTRDAFPKSLVERSREARARRVMKLADDKKSKAAAELRPTIEHEKSQILHELVSGKTAPAPIKQKYAIFDVDLERQVNE